MLHRRSLCNLMTEKLSSLFFYLTFWGKFSSFYFLVKSETNKLWGWNGHIQLFHRKWRKMWVFPPSQGNNSLPFHLLENMLPLFRKAQVSMESHKEVDIKVVFHGKVVVVVAPTYVCYAPKKVGTNVKYMWLHQNESLSSKNGDKNADLDEERKRKTIQCICLFVPIAKAVMVQYIGYQSPDQGSSSKKTRRKKFPMG